MCAEAEEYHEPLPGQFVLCRDRNGKSRIRAIGVTTEAKEMHVRKTLVILILLKYRMRAWTEAQWWALVNKGKKLWTS